MNKKLALFLVALLLLVLFILTFANIVEYKQAAAFVPAYTVTMELNEDGSVYQQNELEWIVQNTPIESISFYTGGHRRTNAEYYGDIDWIEETTGSIKVHLMRTFQPWEIVLIRLSYTIEPGCWRETPLTTYSLWPSIVGEVPVSFYKLSWILKNGIMTNTEDNDIESEVISWTGSLPPDGKVHLTVTYSDDASNNYPIESRQTMSNGPSIFDRLAMWYLSLVYR